MYAGNPRIKQRKSIHTALMVFLNHLCWRSSMLLILLGIVFFKELEVFIKTFSSVKDIEIVFCNDKGIEFMVSQLAKGRGLVVKCLNKIQGGGYSWQVGHER